MKKNGILNRQISKVLSDMGHTDTICIADCGLPIPKDVECIDLAVRQGSPCFIDILQEVEKDMKIEKLILANEIKENNMKILEEVKILFPDIKIEFMAHKDLKENTKLCKAVIRTGEITPYANVILQSACIF